MVNVTIVQGELKGGEAVTSNSFKYYEFLSIPYAKPPIGDLRFKCPQPPESWQNQRDATTSSMNNISCQLDLKNGGIAGSEDCLYLNVYTPVNPSSDSKKLPVMVYIHAGGYLSGHGLIKEELSPDPLIEHEVLVVTINYRLGVLGFLNLDIPEASGNMGLKDQVIALEWVQTNIENFGGDKNNVTIFGISAGSASVEYLLLSPLAKGLFHRAIMQSGSSINDWANNYNYDEVVVKLVDKLGFKGNTDDKRELHHFLMNVPSSQIAGAAFEIIDSYTMKSIFIGFGPTVEKISENAFLTESPYKLIEEGRFSKVPIIKGFCTREGLLVSIMKPITVNDLLQNKNFTDYWPYKLEADDETKYLQKFRQLYSKSPEEEEHDKFAVDFFGDLHFTGGIFTSLKAMVKAGVPAYVYKFTYDGKINYFKKMFGLMKKGASHYDDLTYLFGNNEINVDPDETDLFIRNKMTKMWTNFAKTSNPGSPDIPVEWTKFTEENKAFLNIDKELSMDYNYEPEKMDVFEEIYQKYKK